MPANRPRHINQSVWKRLALFPQHTNHQIGQLEQLSCVAWRTLHTNLAQLERRHTRWCLLPTLLLLLSIFLALCALAKCGEITQSVPVLGFPNGGRRRRRFAHAADTQRCRWQLNGCSIFGAVAKSIEIFWLFPTSSVEIRKSLYKVENSVVLSVSLSSILPLSLWLSECNDDYSKYQFLFYLFHC